MRGGIFRLENPVKEYSWGSRTAIQDLLGLPPEAGRRPMAELWIGAHPTAPSMVLEAGGKHALDRLIKDSPEALLGSFVAERFGRELPFLFKFLAAEKPLSIQVHPGKSQAEEGFRRENQAGVPLESPERTYKDRNHKPELLCAVTPFYALKGFRPAGEAAELLRALVPEALSDEIPLLDDKDQAQGLRRFFTAFMSSAPDRRHKITEEAAARSSEEAGRSPAFNWVERLAGMFPGDPGALAPAFLNLIVLQPGEAVFIRPGELHAYLEGSGLEIMANSDNVIRGGLTGKHVDQAELLRTVVFESGAPALIRGVDSSAGELLYECPAIEFLLARLEVTEDRPFLSAGERSIAIYLVLQGRGRVTSLHGGEDLAFSRGTSFLVAASAPAYRIEGRAILYRASVPAEKTVT
ncbi:MAG: mannose-6-phosphate isomerase, class I [Desulfobacteraceae bacterium]